MEDVFKLIEQEKALNSENRKMIEALEQNHWSENVIVENERQQRILHDFYVERKSLQEIAECCNISKERVRKIKARGVVVLRRYIDQIENPPPVIEEPSYEPEFIEHFGYDIYEAMAYPEESRIKEVTHLLNTSTDDCDFSVRTTLRLKSARVLTLNDLVNLNFPIDLLRISGFGKKCLVEVEAFIIENGLKFRSWQHSKQPYVRLTPLNDPGVYSPIPERWFSLPVSYPVVNFVWSAKILKAFKQHNIITIDGLLMARELLEEDKNISKEHFNFIERRLKEWGLKWN